MSKLSGTNWRACLNVAPVICAATAAFGVAFAANAGGDPGCPNPAGGDCFTATPGTTGCLDAACCNLVCDTLPECCVIEWDQFCADQALIVCEAACTGTQAVYSNVTTFNGDGHSAFFGSVVYADDILPDSGGLVAEISFSIANFDLDQDGLPGGAVDLTSPLTNGVISIVLIDLDALIAGDPGDQGILDPAAIFAEIEVDLTGVFDQGDPLGANEGTVLTVVFTPEDAIFIPPGVFMAGWRPDSAVWQGATPAQGINHLGQLFFNPPDFGASDDIGWFETFGFGFFGGDPVTNMGWEFVVACGPGACCFPEDGSCDDTLDEAGCEAAGGLFAGAGFLCEDVICPVLGACCLVGGQCVDDLFEGECELDFGGTWQGPETNCPIACPPPCNQACAGTPEGELCGQATNEGCNSETGTDFGSIDCGETVCGSAWADGGTRDTDWYLIDVPAVDGSGNTAVTVTLSAEFPADSFLLLVTDCNAITLPDPDNNGVNVDAGCAAGSDSYTVCLPVGQYAIFVGAAVLENPIFEGVPCGSGANDYRLSVTCGPCTGAACPQDCVTSATFAPPPDGNVDAADLAFLLGDWGSPSLTPGSCADTVTSATFAPPPDGNTDAADLAALLGVWGTPGCQP